jgi:hypothetical protein
MNTLALLTVAGLCALAAPAHAVPIVIGVFPDPPGGDSAANQLAFLNSTVIPAYTPALPNDLPPALAGASNVDVGGELLQISLNPSGYEYLKLKWGNTWQFYYTAGETLPYNFVSPTTGPQGQQQGLSHYTFFNSTLAPGGPGTIPGPGVPDGGTAVVLFGISLCGLELVRRRFLS